MGLDFSISLIIVINIGKPCELINMQCSLVFSKEVIRIIQFPQSYEHSVQETCPNIVQD